MPPYIWRQPSRHDLKPRFRYLKNIFVPEEKILGKDTGSLEPNLVNYQVKSIKTKTNPKGCTLILNISKLVLAKISTFKRYVCYAEPN